MNTFHPDLVIEVTGACNKSCKGCYAPNVVSKEKAEVLVEKMPGLFITFTALNRAFHDMSNIPGMTAVRGGEPTLHPKLPTLLRMIKSHSSQVYLETHGEWLLEKNRSSHNELIEALIELKVIVKVSFDKMHGSKKENLEEMIAFLRESKIDFKIAITEESLTDYLITRSLCSWVDDREIIFQLKAVTAEELIQPEIGTIDVQGRLNKTVTHKFRGQHEMELMA